MTNLDDQVRQFVHQEIPWLRDDIPANADIVGTANIDGDDVFDLVAEFGRRFNVNLDDFQPYRHAGPEGDAIRCGCLCRDGGGGGPTSACRFASTT